MEGAHESSPPSTPTTTTTITIITTTTTTTTKYLFQEFMYIDVEGDDAGNIDTIYQMLDPDGGTNLNTTYPTYHTQ